MTSDETKNKISKILITNDSEFIISCGFDVNFLLWKVNKNNMNVQKSQKLTDHKALVVSLVFAKNES